jgi:ligand-binding SRPBCC domain-containing protein
MTEFLRSSILAAPPDAVWRYATTREGANDELRPLLRQTFPSRLHSVPSLNDLPAGSLLGPNWLLLAGVVPVERAQLTLTEIGPGLRFRQTASTLSLRWWEHERTVNTSRDGCEVRDLVAYELRPALAGLPGGGRLVDRCIRAVWERRHRRLRRLWNSAGIDPAQLGLPRGLRHGTPTTKP